MMERLVQIISMNAPVIHVRTVAPVQMTLMIIAVRAYQDIQERIVKRLKKCPLNLWKNQQMIMGLLIRILGLLIRAVIKIPIAKVVRPSVVRENVFKGNVVMIRIAIRSQQALQRMENVVSRVMG
jgi:predicted transporter